MATLYVVTGDQYRIIDRRMREIKRQLDQNEGSPFNPEWVAKELQQIVEGGSGYFKRDMRKEGWELLEDVDFTPINPAKLELVSFIKNNESSIGGEEMVRRGRELRANLGQRHAEFLLERQAEIPKEFRKYYIVFTGTIWRSPDGRRSVACLYWRGERWILFFPWLGLGWRSSGRLARPRE